MEGYVTGSEHGFLAGRRPVGVGSARSPLAGLAGAASASVVMIDLGTLGGTYSEANAVNASGQVVGYRFTADGKKHAALSKVKPADCHTH